MVSRRKFIKKAMARDRYTKHYPEKHPWFTKATLFREYFTGWGTFLSPSGTRRDKDLARRRAKRSLRKFGYRL